MRIGQSSSSSIPSPLAQRVAPAVRIVNPIDESQRVTLTHTVSPLANAANDRGVAPDGMQLDRMQLVLQRSPARNPPSASSSRN